MKQIKIIVLLLSVLIFTSCHQDRLLKYSSATILIKTPSMRFYDKGFIKRYQDYIYLEILNSGRSVLKLQVYKDKICKDSLRCINSKEFNKLYLSSLYQDDFLYTLLAQNKQMIRFKDKKENIKIMIKKD